MDKRYETQISDARWWAYDIPGNIGWIMYIAVLILSFVKQPVFMEIPLVWICLVIAVLPAVAMVVGIAELISERIHKLDRILPKKRLYRGFGALTWGGFGGILVSLNALFASLRAGCSLADCKYLVNAFALKDVLTCIDDLHPSSRMEEQKMNGTAQAIMRAYGDRPGKGRFRSDSTLIESRPPQEVSIDAYK